MLNNPYISSEKLQSKITRLPFYHVTKLYSGTCTIRTKTSAHKIRMGSNTSIQMSRVMRKPAFAYAKTKTQISTADQRLCFRNTESLFFLNTKCQASSHLVWLYSLVYVGRGRKPRRPIFSQRGSNNVR